MDHSNTTVILIGSSLSVRDKNIPPIPNVKRNISELKKILSDNNACGISPENITQIVDETKQETIERVYRLCKQQKNSNLLVVYYAGHGVFSDEDFSLFLTAKDSCIDSIIVTGIKANDLAELIKRSPAGQKILIIDSCFSGSILGIMSDNSESRIIAEMKKSTYNGIYTIASSNQNEPSRFDPYDSNIPTYFTGQFIEVLSEGININKQYLSVDDIYDELKRNLNKKNLPAPVKKISNDGNYILFSKNKKYELLTRNDFDELTAEDVEILLQKMEQDVQKLKHVKAQKTTDKTNILNSPKRTRYVIRAFKATEDADSCERMIAGHRSVLESYGIANITSQSMWSNDPNIYCLIAESEDKKEVFGGVRLQIHNRDNPLPIEKVIGQVDLKIHEYLRTFSSGTVGELCGLWNSRSAAGLGFSRLLTLCGVSISNGIGIKSLLALAAPITMNQLSELGFTPINMIGNEGQFNYPKLNLIAIAMAFEDVTNLSKISVDEQIQILQLRQSKIQTRENMLRNKDAVVDFRLQIP